MIFDTLSTYDENEWEAKYVTLSCIEIHIETVRDLLEPTNEST
jgi:hypothetical protein